MNCSLCWKTSSRCFTRMQPLWMSSVTLVSTESAVAITSFASSVSLSRRFLFVPVPETKHVKPRSALFPKKQAELGTFPCHGTESFHFLLNPYPRAWGLTTPPSNPSCLSEQNQDLRTAIWKLSMDPNPVEQTKAIWIHSHGHLSGIFVWQ